MELKSILIPILNSRGMVGSLRRDPARAGHQHLTEEKLSCSGRTEQNRREDQRRGLFFLITMIFPGERDQGSVLIFSVDI